MARHAMPRDLRPTFAFLARSSFQMARLHRTGSWL